MTPMLKLIIALLLVMPISFWGENLLNPLKQTVQDETPPNLLNLSSNWWNYYDVDPETLAKRKDATEKMFSETTQSLPEAEKFIAGLQTLIELKGKTTAVVGYVATFPAEYTFQEWLALGEKLLENQHDLEEKELKFNLMQLSIRSGSRQLDTYFAAYLIDKKEDPSVRLFKSLEIMNMKVNLAIEQIRLSMLKVEVETQKDKIKQIEKEVHYSHTHIDYKTGNVTEIDAKIAEIEERIKSSQDAPVDQILDQMLVINFKIQKWILLKNSPIEEIHDFKDQIDLLEKETEDWKNKTELMLQQALKNPTLLPQFQQLLENTEAILLKIQQIKNEIFFSKFLLDQVNVLEKQIPTTFGGFFVIAWNGIAGFFSAHGTWFKQSLFKFGNVPITPQGILKVILIILIAYLLGKFFKKSIHKFGKKHELMANSSLYIISRLVYYIILVIGFIIAGASLGFDLTAFAFIAGAITVWIGFSLQSIFHNFISGIIILLTKTLNVGDVIVLDSGESGTIVDINLRTTILATADGVDIVIPNSDLVTKKFTNRTLVKNSRRINVPFRVPLGVDKGQLKKILIEAVMTAPITLPNPEPELWVMGYGDNYLNCELAVWVNEFLSPLPNMSTNAYYFNLVDDALRAHNIEIPPIVHGYPIK